MAKVFILAKCFISFLWPNSVILSSYYKFYNLLQVQNLVSPCLKYLKLSFLKDWGGPEKDILISSCPGKDSLQQLSWNRL